MPNPGTMHVSAPLTTLAGGYVNEQFVARRVFPLVDAPKQSAKIYTVDAKMSHLRLRETLRAPTAPAALVDERVQSTTIEIPDHALGKVIAYEDAQNADEAVQDLVDEQQVALQLADDIALQEEYALSAALFNTTTFSGYTDTTAHKWDQGTPTDSPIDIIRAAKSNVGGRVLKPANCVLVGQAVHDAICKAVRTNLQYVNADSISEDMLRRLFELDDYIVGKAGYNSAAEDATASPARLWATEYMLVFHRAPRPTRKTVSLGYTVYPRNLGVNGRLTEREQIGRGALSRQVTVHSWYYQHLMFAAAGELHTNCVGSS